MEDRNNKPSPEKLTEEMKKDALDKLDEITQGMTPKQKKKVIDAIRTGRVRIMSQEEIDELKAKGAEGVEAVPLKSGAGPKFTKSTNTPQKKAARKKNRAASKSRARNRR